MKNYRWWELTVQLYWLLIWLQNLVSLTIRKQHRLSALEIRVVMVVVVVVACPFTLQKGIEPLWEQGAGKSILICETRSNKRMEKLHKEELHNFHSLPNIRVKNGIQFLVCMCCIVFVTLVMSIHILLICKLHLLTNALYHFCYRTSCWEMSIYYVEYSSTEIKWPMIMGITGIQRSNLMQTIWQHYM
jgi:hypothetical protein